MDSDAPLEYALFQLSPRRSHCELFVCGDGKTEKIASGLVKPFVANVKVAEEQAALPSKFIKLQVERPEKARTWFNKGTLERFVRFVSTPEILEAVHTFDAEMSQLEGARRIYSQGADDQVSRSSGDNEKLASASRDATKKELLRAIDVRLDALRQDLTTACARAASAGFTLHTISELLHFARYFGAPRLNDACDKFSLLCQRRPDISTQHHLQQQQLSKGRKQSVGDGDIHSSSDSDMSLDGPDDTLTKTSISDSSKPNNLQSSSQQYKMPKSSIVEMSLGNREVTGLKGSGQMKNPEASAPPGTTQPSSGSRRLSVQDRINLFESKQKEQGSGIPSLAGSAGGSIGSRNVGRPELRRLSSDVSSSVEKSVLRRWSGASDMSLDLGSGSNSISNKNEDEIIATAPSDSSGASNGFPNIPAGAKNEEKDTATSQPALTMDEILPPILQHKAGSVSIDNTPADGILSKDEIDLRTSPISLRDRSLVMQLNMDNAQLSGQTLLKSQQASLSAALIDSGLQEQSSAQKSIDTLPAHANLMGPKTIEKSTGSKHVSLREKERSSSARASQNLNRERHIDMDQDAISSLHCSSTCAEVHGSNAKESLSEIRASHNKEEIKSNRKSTSKSQVPLRISKTEVAQLKGTNLAPQITSTSEEINTHSLACAPEPSLRDLSAKVRNETRAKNTTHLERNPHKLASDSRRLQSSRDETSIPPQSLSLHVSGQKTESSTDSCDLVSSSREPTQVARPTKGNQQLNDDLQTKADELEKLFAEHMLKVPGDLSSKRGKPVDVYPKIIDKRTEEVLPNQVSEGRIVKDGVPDAMEFDAKKLFDIVNNQDYFFGAKFGDLSLLEDLRGKFYEHYMQKRDMKLREEWRSAKASKEAKMKAMHESLEQSRAEMKAKFSGSADRQNSAMLIQRRAEKLRSISAHSAMKYKEQPIKLLQKEEEDVEEFVTLVGCESCDQEEFTSGTAADGYSKSTFHKKRSSSRSISSTPRTSTISPNPPFDIRGSDRRRIQSENSLTQSVPNFADLRKENAKPFSRTEKVVNRAQLRSSKYGKGIDESITTIREDKPHRSKSTRKEFASPIELSDLSSVNSDNLNMERTERNIFQKGADARPFLRKGKGIGPGAGAVVAKTKASMVSPNTIPEKSQDFTGPEAELSNIIKEEDNYEIVAAEVASSMDNDNAFSSESVHSDDPESGNGETSELQDDSSSLYAVIPSELKSFGEGMHESPGESPGSWTSRVHHSFSYAQEASDIDVSVDSPSGSPASCSFNSLNNLMDPDASRMRKKWGVAQKPMFVSGTMNHPKKDVTTGLKRLLMFGRKNKGVDTLLPDWVSASTNSEGDDDSEDGRDSGYPLSDDMPKSRMGFSQYQSACDGFDVGGSVQEEGRSLGTSIPIPPANFKLREDHLSGSSLKAPRSFFSLSTFRNKGSDSKLR